MAIRFYCQRCGQLLSIASRKAGTIIDCPKCATGQEVPSQEAADAAMSLAAASEKEKYATDGSAAMVQKSAQSANILPTPTLDDSVSFGSTASGSPRDEYILLPRRTIYLQGILFVVVGLLALSMGFLIGRGGVMENGSNGEGASDSTAADPVLIEGNLTFETENGETRPDHNAVIIVLPEGLDVDNQQPDRRIPSPGIRPLDSPPPKNYGSLLQIVEMGGCYTRADKDGSFSLVLPDSGRYHLLLISRGARRPDGSPVDADDLEFLTKHFRRPNYLVGEQEYRLSLEKFEGRARIEHVFGSSGK